MEMPLKTNTISVVILLSTIFFTFTLGFDFFIKNEFLLWATALLIFLNFVLSLTYLFRHGKITLGIICLNMIQIALFCRLFILIHDVLGAQHYSYELDPQWYDWVELVAIHVLRAIDLLDILSAYDIDLQSVNPQSALVGGILVSMHVMVDIFIMGAIIIFIRRYSAAMKEKGTFDFLGEKTRLFLKILRYTFEWSVIFLVIYVAVSNNWGLKNLLLWSMDNLLRTLDVGDAIEIFDWQSHGIEMNIWLETLAVLFRVVVSVYVLGFANIVFLHLFGGGGKTIEELAEICNSSDEYSDQERRLAINALIRFQSTAIIPHLVTTLVNRNSYMRHTAAIALKNIDNKWQESDIGVRAIHNFAIILTKDRNYFSREAAAEALGLMGSAAVKVVPLLVRALIDNKRAVRITAANTLRKIAPRWAQEGSKQTAIKALVNALTGTKKEIHQATLDALKLMGSSAIDILPYFIQAVAHSNIKIRTAVTNALLEQADPLTSALPRILLLLADSQERSFASSILGKLKPKVATKTVPLFRNALAHPNSQIRSFAATVLGNLGSSASEAVYKLIRVSVDSKLEVCLAAATALDEINPEWQQSEEAKRAMPHLVHALSIDRLIIGDTKFIPILVHALSAQDQKIRRKAINLLGKIGATDATVIQGLASLLYDKDNEICYAAVIALGNIGAPAVKSLPLLVTMVKHENEQIRKMVIKSLDQINPHWWRSKEVKASYKNFTEFGFKTSVK